MGGGSSVLNLLCTKDQASENCEHRSGIWQIFRQVVKGIPRHVFPTAFSSGASAPLSWDLNQTKTHGAWLQELMTLRLRTSHWKKNSVRDTVIGKRWICSDSERSTLCGCGPLQRASVSAMEYGVASFCDLGEFIC